MIIQDFINELVQRSSTDDVSNIYSSSIQAENITKYLNYYTEIRPHHILVGEAPGYKGCGKTGIPFVDEYTISENDFLKKKLNLESLGNEKERTSSLIWKNFGKQIIVNKILFWNIFPFHPHLKDKLNSNRTPRSEELQEGLNILKKLLCILEIDKENVFCIGMSAYSTIFNEDPKNYLRHPSYGGQELFIEKFSKLFN